MTLQSRTLLELKPLFVMIKPPVLNAPWPELVFELAFGAMYRLSPNCTVPPPIFTICTGPIIAGIENILFLLLLNNMLRLIVLFLTGQQLPDVFYPCLHANLAAVPDVDYRRGGNTDDIDVFHFY